MEQLNHSVSMDAPKHLLRKSIASGGIEILKIVALGKELDPTVVFTMLSNV